MAASRRPRPKEPTSAVRLAVLETMLEERHQENKETLGEILAQVTRTNGRVNDLESWRDQQIGAVQRIDKLRGSILLIIPIVTAGITFLLHKLFG